MTRSFEITERKLAEAEFFLAKICAPELDPFALRCYFSAFVNACRSVTFAMQASLTSLPEFKSWYSQRQDALRQDGLARFMHKVRDVETHIGETLIRSGRWYSDADGGHVVEYFFSESSELPDGCAIPSTDVATSCKRHFVNLATIVLECYDCFGDAIDPHQYYSQEYFSSIGRDIGDAEEEIIGIRGWTEAPGIPLEARWQMLRNQVPGCAINFIFEKYCGRMIPSAERYARENGMRGDL